MKYYLLFCISMAAAHRGFIDEDNASLHDEEESFHFGDDLKDNEAEIEESEEISFEIEPKLCPKNMTPYPGPGRKNSSWICGCKPGFLYFTFDKSCHEAYRQGPCSPTHYVHLAIGDSVPRCATNPCIMDGLVPYKGVCFPLKQLGAPCADDGFLFVNEKSFQVECVSISKTRHPAYLIVRVPNTGGGNPQCPPGTRRDPAGICKKPIP